MIDLEKLADQMGIARDYIDSCGQYTVIAKDSRIAALSAMGFPVHDESEMEEVLKTMELHPYTEVMEPVLVLRDGDKPFIYFNTPAPFDEKGKISWSLTLEDGTEYKDSCPLSEIEIADYKTVQGQEFDKRRFILKEDLPYGYHSFKIKISGVGKTINKEMSLIRAPLKCYVPKEIAEGRKIWGVSTQLYSLRSKQNWGIGDFHDLKDLLSHVAAVGGHFVGLNPLHAGYPANPDPDMVSPYSPSSRYWLNVIYIRIEDIPEFNLSAKAKEIVYQNSFQQKLRALRDREYVDYRTIIELKLKVLRTLFDSLRLDDKRSLRGRKFLEFIEKGGSSLINMATYDAMQASLYAKGVNAWGWKLFPKEYRSFASPFVEAWRKEHIDEVRFYCYLQFIAKEQLEEAYAVAQKTGMIIGTYRDLAVGVAPGSCDVWSDEDGIYREKAEIGAPPDMLGPLGQSWGLAPMDPYSLKQSAYRKFIALYQANMQSCGALRIDHAAGLYRMWWVPPEHRPTEGAYVAYPIHDLLGIIALESHRNKCMLIAEDLGTIPMELRHALKEANTFSYKLFFGERAFDGGYIAPKDYEKQAISALTTHDMPTLKGWWTLSDLTLGQKLGIYAPSDATRLASDRNNAKQRILDSLHGLMSVGTDVPRHAADCPMSDALALGMQIHMCRGSCALYSSQIEDWIGVEKPVNVPGTFREYPNWRRKLTANLDEIFSDPKVLELTAKMTQARDHAK